MMEHDLAVIWERNGQCDQGKKRTGSTITVAKEDGGPISRVLVHLEEGRAIGLCAGSRMLMALMRLLWRSWYRRAGAAGLPIVEAFKMGPRRQIQ